MPSKNMSLPRVPKGRSKGLDPPDMDIFPIRTTSTKDYRRTTIRQATGAQAEPARRPQVGGQFQQASYTPPPQEEVLTGIWPRLKQKASVGTFSTSSSTRATPSLPSEPQIELLGLGIAGLLPGTTPQANSIKGTIFKMFGRNANSDVPVGSSRSPSRQSERPQPQSRSASRLDHEARTIDLFDSLDSPSLQGTFYMSSDDDKNATVRPLKSWTSRTSIFHAQDPSTPPEPSPPLNVMTIKEYFAQRDDKHVHLHDSGIVEVPKSHHHRRSMTLTSAEAVRKQDEIKFRLRRSRASISSTPDHVEVKGECASRPDVIHAAPATAKELLAQMKREQPIKAATHGQESALNTHVPPKPIPEKPFNFSLPRTQTISRETIARQAMTLESYVARLEVLEDDMSTLKERMIELEQLIFHQQGVAITLGTDYPPDHTDCLVEQDNHMSPSSTAPSPELSRAPIDGTFPTSTWLHDSSSITSSTFSSSSSSLSSTSTTHHPSSTKPTNPTTSTPKPIPHPNATPPHPSHPPPPPVKLHKAFTNTTHAITTLHLALDQLKSRAPPELVFGMGIGTGMRQDGNGDGDIRGNIDVDVDIDVDMHTATTTAITKSITPTTSPKSKTKSKSNAKTKPKSNPIITTSASPSPSPSTPPSPSQPRPQTQTQTTKTNTRPRLESAVGMPLPLTTTQKRSSAVFGTAMKAMLVFGCE